ncbi:bifunctional diguanylate cyclase/phosphodiesterase [Thalassotalea nanhaiensis]|uniref:Bifunctional diguanylate cyclase/phosphodiesterase n=1 Tax=Thalassotalea nanhaiensis TaxID=3065648 RepID=A0ABY9TL73_9GAMM|nr:bifunctional diguanylate cyclase/phosphodiesterase [Colwelliaceae bacterium SQ345]
MTSISLKLFGDLSNTLIATGFYREKSFQVFLVSQVALLIAFIIQLSNAAYGLAGALFLVFVAIAASFLSLYKKHPKTATGILLFGHTCLATVLMWSYGGMRDEVLFVYPMVLIFATLLGSTKLVTIIFSIISIVIFANGYANQYGLYTNNAPQIDLQSAAIINLILLVIFICSYFAAQNIKELINKLVKENEKVEKSKREIQKLVHQDALTGLPNRVVAESKFKELVVAAKDDNTSLALLFVDLDDFKNINDTLGHHVGDKFLKIISTRMAGKLAGIGSLYRLGGDEFIILLNSASTTAEVKKISETISRTVSEPLTINDCHLSACCSIGVTIAPTDAEDFDTALKYADIALYEAKSAGRNQICLITDKMIEKTETEFILLEELRKALRDESFKVHFQPKLDLVTKEVIGAEALLRWWHPTMGQITPNQFIPLAEKSGLIKELGFWVLEQSIKECVYWHKRGYKDLVIAVNLSPIQFNSPDFTKSVLQLLGRHGLSESHLELEITENVLIEQNDVQRANINMLAAAGIKLAIDDFGKGYSNLAYIKKLNIDSIKIDFEFVKGMASNDDDLAIVTAIIDIAKRLGIKSVAEGVESEDISSLLKELGCNSAQGFLWSHALESSAFNAFLDEKE